MIIIRSSNFSAVRFTDFVSVPADPSDKSLGYFQPSAKRGLSTDFLGKANDRRDHRFESRLLLVLNNLEPSAMIDSLGSLDLPTY